MILGIDASNLRTGGGVTHLIELLRTAHPLDYGFNKIIVWGGNSTLSQLEERPWLCKVHEPLLDRSLLFRLYWQRFILPSLTRQSYDLLFVPGGSVHGNPGLFVTMCQNMLPFEWQEARRFGISKLFLKMMLLRVAQSLTFRKAGGVIFLTKYARDGVMKVVRHYKGRSTIIPHGVDARFMSLPREQRDIKSYSKDRPFRILYVSTIDVFKHQWNVVDAVAQLCRAGLPIQLDLVGSAYKPALKRLNQAIRNNNITDKTICYHGPVPYVKIPDYYKEADMFAYASSCENMPNILLEAMASGLPIACSNKGPMFEVLGDAGTYFDPEKPADIVNAIKKLIDSPVMRQEKANAAYNMAKNYTWERCARDTFTFFNQVASI